MPQPTPLPKLGILGSGTGTNMVAIADAQDRGELPAEICIVISDVEGAPILQKATDRGIPSVYVPPGPYSAKLDETAEQKILELLNEHGAQWIALAGFMRILKGAFLRAFPDRIVNIHPSLLPAFPGLRAWRQAMDYGAQMTGCTVHLVDRGIDTGTILAQAAAPILPEDTEESLLERIHQQEWALYPKTIAQWIQGEYRIQGRRALRRSQD